MPSKKLMWTERVLDFWAYKMIRIEKREEESNWWWFLGRVSFLFVIWLIGFVLYLADGLVISYVLDFRTYAMLFGLGFLIFFGSSGLRSYLSWFSRWVRPMLSLNERQFETFRNRIERFATSFFAVFGLSLVLVFCLTDVFEELRQAFIRGIVPHTAWNVAFTFFIWLIIATGVWLILSTWLTVFLMSRQPLKLKLSRETSKAFQPVSRWVLYCSLGYFTGVAMSIFFPPAGVPSLGVHIEIALASYLLFSLVGALCTIIPFYNIHMVFVHLKKQELQKINEESDKLVSELDDILTRCTSKDCKDQAAIITARLLSLQFKEKNIRELEEWPVSISFFSTLASLIVLPLVVRAIIEFITRTFF